jgi:hypothetical protein
VRVVVDVRDWVPVGNGSGVEGPVIAAGTPAVVLLGYQVESGRPGTLGTASSAVANHGFKLGLGDCEPVGCQTTRSAGDGGAWNSPYGVDGVVAHLPLHSGGPSEVREL